YGWRRRSRDRNRGREGRGGVAGGGHRVAGHLRRLGARRRFQWRRRWRRRDAPVRVGADETGDQHVVIVSLGAVAGSLFEGEPHGAEIDLLRLRKVGGGGFGVL